ncbi:Sec1-like protein [Coleophoma cylindrospora]|uniref:Sec1-like protein n=1 Tax=Coleophoma cylindrospora TaxID=1849047 RepID=A0A3D8R6Q6_9HELO|nr:Sec1-like protein [Coleophoma cylindrospora]
MGASVIQEQRDLIVNTIKNITRGDWKVLVVDEAAKKIIDNVVKEDDILNENIANIERIEERRDMNPEMDAIYILSPQPHIVDCLMADFERRRYKKSFLVWTALLDPQMRRRIDSSNQAQQQLAGFETLSIDYFPRESHLITFRDPWSFPILFHPDCNGYVRDHMQLLAQKITGICVSLGEYPKVRYYRPRNPTHEASVLCSHLARFVQEELDAYAQWNKDFPPPAARPQGVLLITDRSMDLVAPLIHEFTYQAMAHDLLPIKEGDKVLYKTVVTEGDGDQQEKEMEIGEKDRIWVENRHRHMKDTIEKLMSDFKKFIDDNPHFANSEGDATSLNAIKDMLAGLPQFQEMKEAYSLHLNMAQECMNIFQRNKLPDIASVEQSLGTGLDEDFRKPKNLADQLVRLLDDEDIPQSDRLRLILLYIMYREGVIMDDVQRLLAHASLPPQDVEVATNLELLGARTTKTLKDPKPATQPLFPRKTAPTADDEEYALSRFEPTLQTVLEEISKGTLDQTLFPYTKPPLDNSEDLAAAQQQTSLRSAKPTWARNRNAAAENKQRIIVLMAGGATYSEARACYDVSTAQGKDIFLATSHMVTPSMFIRQVSDLSAPRKQLNLPIERPPQKAPEYLFLRNDPKPQPPPQPMGMPGGPGARRGPGMGLPAGAPLPPPQSPAPPTAGMANLSVNGQNGGAEDWPAPVLDKKGKLEKKDKHKEDKKDKHKDGEKKKRGFFGSKKDKS